MNFNLDKALIIRGTVVKALNLPICRNQVVIKVSNAHSIIDNYIGFHWVMVYGDYGEEIKEVFEHLGVKSVLL